MTWNLHGTHAQENDLVELVGLGHKHFIITLKAGEELHTHRGIVRHDDLIGLEWGSQLFSHNGAPFFMLQPALDDLLTGTPRNTQIIYPKEIGTILVSMGIGPGQVVLEAGTGSGALTTAMAFAVGNEGHVYSYEIREDTQRLAMKNLARLGLMDRVTFKLRDIVEGFDERGVDALFLDVQRPQDYISQSREALKMGGFFGSILPTTNQVIRLLGALKQYDFGFVNVFETLMRYYKSDPDHFRPVDRMVAHTGFLIFARPVKIDHTSNNDEIIAVEEE